MENYSAVCNECHCVFEVKSQAESDRYSACGMCIDCEGKALEAAHKDASLDMVHEKLELLCIVSEDIAELLQELIEVLKKGDNKTDKEEGTSSVDFNNIIIKRGTNG
jgi:hypothetical protein